MDRRDHPFGFILVTARPMLRAGQYGSAIELIRARLLKLRWPLYKQTRNRRAIGVGSRLAFYVAGRSEGGGQIVARATVDAVIPAGRVSGVVDPPEYLTEVPYIVLKLRDVTWLSEPVHFREAIERLSFRPTELRDWGKQLQGGVRALGEDDWSLLFDPNTRREALDATSVS